MSASQPLIDVIVPVFNGARFLRQALTSVLAQSYRRINVIVVDDGSTDNSAAIVAEFGVAVSYVYQANSGAGSARNCGIALGGGDFIAFIDQDDLWHVEKLMRQLAAFSANPLLEAVFTGVQQFYGDAIDFAGHTAPVGCSPPVAGLLPSALLIKRASFLRIGLFGTGWRVGEWSDWYARARDAALLYSVEALPLTYRRVHGSNTSLTAQDALFEYARLLKMSLERRRARQKAQ